jgi:hypothetical protein
VSATNVHVLAPLLVVAAIGGAGACCKPSPPGSGSDGGPGEPSVRASPEDLASLVAYHGRYNLVGPLRDGPLYVVAVEATGASGGTAKECPPAGFTEASVASLWEQAQKLGALARLPVRQTWRIDASGRMERLEPAAWQATCAAAGCDTAWVAAVCAGGGALAVRLEVALLAKPGDALAEADGWLLAAHRSQGNWVLDKAESLWDR